MKAILCLIVLTLVTAQHVQAQGAAGAIAIKRARDLSNQNNVRQGVNAPAAPAQPATPQPAQPQRADPVAKLKASIAAITDGPAVSAEQKKQLTADILACARGSKKPSLAGVDKFATGLADAIVGKSMEASVQSRLASDINIAVNSASLSAQRTTEVGDDVQAILQTAGMARGPAITLSGQLKTTMAELQDVK